LALVAAALVLAVAVAAVWMLLARESIFPARTLAMATGPEGSAEYDLGVRYRAALARAGLDLRLLPTAGSVENLAMLRDRRSGVSVGFVDAGVTGEEAPPDLASLGTVSFQPLWFFLRSRPHASPIEALAGKRISVGPEGSGTRVLARRLLALNGIDEARVELVGLTPEQAADALLKGGIDAAVLLTSWQSPAVRRLLLADGITLATYPRADAYVALFPYLTKLRLPTGVADLARNIPPVDVTLLAVEESLVVRRDLPAALQFLLLETAGEVHGGPGVFHSAGRFPAPETIDIPLSDVAREFHKAGRPFVYRNLPFWLAGLAEHLLIVLVPLFAVVLPAARYLPMLYEMVIERRIFKRYTELKLIETEMEALGPGEASDALAVELEELARRANRLKVPLHFAQRLFILKNHIAVAQEQVERRRHAAPRTAGEGH